MSHVFCYWKSLNTMIWKSLNTLTWKPIAWTAICQQAEACLLFHLCWRDSANWVSLPPSAAARGNVPAKGKRRSYGGVPHLSNRYRDSIKNELNRPPIIIGRSMILADHSRHLIIPCWTILFFLHHDRLWTGPLVGRAFPTRSSSSRMMSGCE